MSSAAEGIRETASNLLRIANRLDGIDVSADAMRSGVRDQCPQGMADGWGHLGGADCSFPERDGASSYRNRADVEREQAEQEYVTPRVLTGVSYGVYVHGDPGAPLKLGGCTWPDGDCTGHRVGLGGAPLERAEQEQPERSVHVPGRYQITQGVGDWVFVKCLDGGESWMSLAVDLQTDLAEHDAEHDGA